MPTDLVAAARDVLTVLQLVEHELLLFASFWFIVGALDEFVVDLSWLALKLTGRARTTNVTAYEELRPLRGKAAVLVAAWREADVIAAMIAHTLKAWPHEELTLYVGCYANDPETLARAIEGAGDDPRIRLVVHDAIGPTTKADCLNRLYRALEADEGRGGFAYRFVALHDAEDMVHPAALSLMDRALADAQFVQLPVRPEPQTASRWIAGHYTDEFAEAHAKAMVVRDVLGAGIPAAGVGCAFARRSLRRLASADRSAQDAGPFAADCLTEDYELGLSLSRGSAIGRFVRCRDRFGELVATRAFFPATLEQSVRQKTRWIHGIAFQGWDRLGWSGGPVDLWMALRDRRGPLAAIVLAAAYVLLVVEGILAIARLAGWEDVVALSPAVRTMLIVSFASFAWRGIWRFGFVAHEYGVIEGLRAIMRIPVANVIAIMAGRRALMAYVGSLRGADVFWDKTEHDIHPSATIVTAQSTAVTR